MGYVDVDNLKTNKPLRDCHTRRFSLWSLFSHAKEQWTISWREKSRLFCFCIHRLFEHSHRVCNKKYQFQIDQSEIKTHFCAVFYLLKCLFVFACVAVSKYRKSLRVCGRSCSAHVCVLVEVSSFLCCGWDFSLSFSTFESKTTKVNTSSKRSCVTIELKHFSNRHQSHTRTFSCREMHGTAQSTYTEFDSIFMDKINKKRIKTERNKKGKNRQSWQREEIWKPKRWKTEL